MVVSVPLVDDVVVPENVAMLFFSDVVHDRDEVDITVGVVVVNNVSATATTIDEVPWIDVERMFVVAMGMTHSIMPVSKGTRASASPDPPLITALEQLGMPAPAHSLYHHKLTLC